MLQILDVGRFNIQLFQMGDGAMELDFLSMQSPFSPQMNYNCSGNVTSYGGYAMPFSVMMAVMSSAGVTSKAGL